MRISKPWYNGVTEKPKVSREELLSLVVMKKLIYLISIVIVACLFATSFSSCSGCESNASRYYDVNVDLDGDGDYGDRSGRKDPSFKGSSRGSCNLPSHKCSGGIDRNGDNYCDRCWSNGYKCHMASHGNY